MITSRGLNLLRFACRRQNKIATTNLQPARLSHGAPLYRSVPPVDKKWLYAAEVVGGAMWWWVLWHLWYEYDHLIGEFPYPDTSKWTDEELGVPPDDYPETATRML